MRAEIHAEASAERLAERLASDSPPSPPASSQNELLTAARSEEEIEDKMRDLGWSADETIAFFTEARRDIRRDCAPRYAGRDARAYHTP